MTRRAQVACPRSIVLALFAASFWGCGGGGSGGGKVSPALDLAGTWTGTWTRDDGAASGPVTLTIGYQHMGHGMNGNAAYGGSPCFEGGTFSGMCSGAMVSGSMMGGEYRVDCLMQAHGGHPTHMGGTYEMVAAGSCTGEKGSIEFERALPVTASGGVSVALRVGLVGPALTEWVAVTRLESASDFAGMGPDGQGNGERSIEFRARGTFDAAGRAEAVLVPPPSWRWAEFAVVGQATPRGAAVVPPAIVAVREIRSPRSP